MYPVIAIVGRPNVGKSTIFNRLTLSRDAIVADKPGVTRDRNFGIGKLGDKPFAVVDTGGIASYQVKGQEIYEVMEEQSLQAIAEAFHVFFVVDAHDGLTQEDRVIADIIRRQNKQVTVVINKIDGKDEIQVKAEFYQLGFKDLMVVSALNNKGMLVLINTVLASFPEVELEEVKADRIKLAIIGQPNVGKSTLVNKILGENRVVVYDKPGTTIDSIYIDFERNSALYTIIDTAGIRRKRSINDDVEKFSIVKTLQAIKDAHVVMVMIDATSEITFQSLSIISFALDAGKGIVIALNKWDLLTQEKKNELKKDLEYRLKFIDFARVHMICAVTGVGVNQLFASVNEAYQSAMKDLSASNLTSILEEAITVHSTPVVKGRRIKLRYAHCGGHNPPRIIIHGNQTDALTESYKKFLEKFFRKKLDLMGTPIVIECKTSDNPYKDNRNTLTPRQQIKRQRLMKFVKKFKK